MTQEQKRIKIAEFNGFTPSKKGDWWNTPEGSQVFEDELPDYFNDMRACSEMVNGLTQDELDQYDSVLRELCLLERVVPDRARVELRAEAFGKAFKLWP